jgi:hypothetical protein
MTERSLQVTYRKGDTCGVPRLNQFLAELGEPPLAEQDYRPASAA